MNLEKIGYIVGNIVARLAVIALGIALARHLFFKDKVIPPKNLLNRRDRVLDEKLKNC